MFKTGLHRFAICLNFLAAAAGSALFILVLLSSVMRYVAGAPFRFTEEIVGLLFISLSFLALPLAYIQRRHIRLGMVADNAHPLIARILVILSLVALIAFSMMTGITMLNEALFSLSLNAKSELSDIPLFPWMLVPPISLAVLIGIALVLGPEHIKSDTNKSREIPE